MSASSASFRSSDVSRTIGRKASAYVSSPSTIASVSDRSPIENFDEYLILVGQRPLDLLSQNRLVEDVLHPDPDAGDLVAVGRPDTSPRRANLALAQESLGDLVECHVVRRDQVRV